MMINLYVLSLTKKLGCAVVNGIHKMKEEKNTPRITLEERT
jgi:hypothetical protein